MTEKPDVLRLAEFYEALAEEPPKSPDNSKIRTTAAELRRLHAEHEEDQRVIAVWRGRTQRAEAQRDALLEALRLVQVDCQYLHHEKEDQHALSQPCPVVDRINAAIKAVEEQK